MRSTKDQLVKKDVLMPVKHNVFLWNLPDVEEMPSHDGETVQFSRIMICLIFVYLSYSPCLFRFFLYVSDSPLVSMEVPLRTAYSQNGRYGMQPKPSSLRAQAQ
ncbi:hypothetical protein TNCV_2670441 [Trichonephila clavipes]|nr:hypothetical protein TNCV_2670441 [Trichonephila clavipes]